MAAMGYNTETVQELMSLVDDHKADLQELSYLKICNAIKYLHQQQEHSQRELAQANHVVQPPPVQYHPPVPPAPNTVPMPRLIRTDTRFGLFEHIPEVQMERHRLHHAREQIREMQDAIATAVPGNIRLVDKYKVLSNLYDYSGPERNADVTAFAKVLQSERILTVKRFKELSLAEKTSRHLRRMASIRADLNRAHDDETLSRQRLIRAINNHSF
jgi:hypothetical protein